MKILRNSNQLFKLLKKLDANIGFVPTMGGLHKGHLSLIKKSKKMGLKTLVSIFINPKQFNNINDYKNYPRNLLKDLRILKENNPDFLFIPSNKDIFRKQSKKKIKLDKFHKYLCGRFRPGHFEGVVDIIERFIKIINPKYIFLGNKDYQQLILIKKHIKKKFKTIVVGCNTIRNKNGLALSTRNYLLTRKEKLIGSKVYKLLRKNKKSFTKKQKKNLLISYLKNKILNLGVKKIDYLDALDTVKNTKFTKRTKKFKLFIAYYLRDIRLIDNI